jgi:hypothetical protein
MIKSLTAFAVFALLGTAVVALPGAPVEAGETVALAKADRLEIVPVATSCSQQVWPHLSAGCLRGSASASSFQEARLVTARR